MFKLAASLHAGPGEGPAFSAVGDAYRFQATGEQTGGAYVLSEARVRPGGGPPPPGTKDWSRG